MLPIIVLACYLISAIWLAAGALRASAEAGRGARVAGLLLGAVALCLHALELWTGVFSRPQLALTVADTASVIGWLVAFIAVVRSWRRPEFGAISALLLLLAGLVALATNEGARNFQVQTGGWELTAHILLSTFAYALLTVGAALALALALLDRRLRSRRPLGALAALPSLEALESAVFQTIGAGFAFLSLALFSGFFFVQNFLTQHLVHKVVLSCLAWVVFGLLLLGRVRFGWRGRKALNWILSGFVLLGLGYFGSKLVLEVILGRHWG